MALYLEYLRLRLCFKSFLYFLVPPLTTVCLLTGGVTVFSGEVCDIGELVIVGLFKGLGGDAPGRG